MKMPNWQIYIIVLGGAALLAAGSKLDDFNYDEVLNWTPVGWSKFLIFVSMQVLVAWKGLITPLLPKSNGGNNHATEEGKK